MWLTLKITPTPSRALRRDIPVETAMMAGKGGCEGERSGLNPDLTHNRIFIPVLGSAHW